MPTRYHDDAYREAARKLFPAVSVPLNGNSIVPMPDGGAFVEVIVFVPPDAAAKEARRIEKEKEAMREVSAV